MAFAKSEDARKAGWFSRRHETNDEHRAARSKYQHAHGPKARQRKALERSQP